MRRRAGLPRARWWEYDPACWRWKAPTDTYIDRVRRECTGSRPLTEQEFCWILMCEWQNDRCAVCGKRCSQNLRTDHDHKTGLVRGFLCPGCNMNEPGGDDDGDSIYAKYRRRCPAMICGLVQTYGSSCTCG